MEPPAGSQHWFPAALREQHLRGQTGYSEEGAAAAAAAAASVNPTDDMIEASLKPCQLKKTKSIKIEETNVL